MRRILSLIVAALAVLVCCVHPVSVETADTCSITRSDTFFDGTIWECQTGNQFNQYLLFKDGEVKAFCGLVENGKLQRWSEYAPVSKPIWGRTNPETELVVDGHIFRYFGVYDDSLEDLWIIINVNIVPWKL